MSIPADAEYERVSGYRVRAILRADSWLAYGVTLKGDFGSARDAQAWCSELIDNPPSWLETLDGGFVRFVSISGLKIVPENFIVKLDEWIKTHAST